MKAKLRKIVAAGLTGALIAGTGLTACIAGFLLAGAGVAAMHIDGRAALPSPRAAKPLLHQVRLTPDTDVPRSFTRLERRDIEAAVRAQIRALARRNAEQAFSQLAPSTQRFFGAPDRFLRVLSQEIPAMLDAKRFAFLGVEQAGRRVTQQVLVTDGMGQEWLADFQLEQLADGFWRIKGCVVQSTPGQQA